MARCGHEDTHTKPMSPIASNGLLIGCCATQLANGDEKTRNRCTHYVAVNTGSIEVVRGRMINTKAV